MPMYGVIMRGHPLFDQYVTSFKILHSYDGTAFHYLTDDTTHPQIFSGPIDPRTPVQSLFKIPIEAKVIRIYPLTWHGGIAIRIELLGCTMKKPDLPAVPPTPNIIVDEFVKPLCDEPMGIDNGLLQPAQIQVSSKKSNINTYDLIKLSTPEGWRPIIDSPNEYVLIDFLEPRNVTGVKTMGGQFGWVTGFNVYYSVDKLSWNPIINPDGNVKTFLCNYDAKSVKVNPFERTINMRYLKVVPTKWFNCIELSIEPIGCYKPYPKLQPVVVPTTPKPRNVSCEICPNVPLNDAADACRCAPPLLWNGNECVERFMCPCMVGHMAYAVGAHYELDDCSKCLCVLGGGVAQCKPLQCPPCEKGLRKVRPSTASSSCTCKCEPCPAGTLLCPTSGVCITTSAWCDGIQDCPDDEVNCVRQPPIAVVTSKPKVCKEPTCPPGFKLVIGHQDKHNPDRIQFDKSTEDNDGYNPLMDVRMGYSHEETDKYDIDLPRPGAVRPTDDDCIQFDCIPVKPTIDEPDYSLKPVCAEPACPKGYEVVIDTKSIANCAKYKCEPLPQNDAVCDVTGRTFNTFDNTTFKYDICNHVLARDLVGNKWSVSSE